MNESSSSSGDTGTQACESAEVTAEFIVDTGTLPTETVQGIEEVGTSVVAECTVADDSTAESVALSCLGSDGEQHDVGITIDSAVPQPPMLTIGDTVDLRVNTWSPLFESEFYSSPEVWFTIRSAEDELLLGGIYGAHVEPVGDLTAADMFAPFTLEFASDVCPSMTGETGGCEVREAGLTITDPDGGADVLVISGNEASVAGTSFALGFAREGVFDVDSGCFIEGDRQGFELLVVRP